MDEKSIAESELRAWKAALLDQKARLFELADEKRNNARNDLQELVNCLNDMVKFDQIFQLPDSSICQGQKIKELMDQVNIALGNVRCHEELLCMIFDDFYIIDADAKLDDTYEIGLRSLLEAEEYLTKEYPEVPQTSDVGVQKQVQEECKAMYFALRLSFSGLESNGMENFWKPFEDRIGRNQFISDCDKFQILKACCIQDAAKFADSSIWRVDPSIEDFKQLAEALRTNFQPNHAAEAPASSDLHLMPVSIQFASEISVETALGIASPLIEEIAPLEAARLMIHEEALLAWEVEIEITPASRPRIAIAVAPAQKVTPGSGDLMPLWLRVKEPMAVTEETATSKAQDEESTSPVMEAGTAPSSPSAMMVQDLWKPPSRGQQLLVQRFMGNEAAPDIGKTARLWMLTKGKTTSAQPIANVGTALFSATPVTKRESLSWLKPITEVGTPLLIPITKRESLSWIKIVKLSASEQNAPFCLPIHALTSVGLKKLVPF